MPRGTGFGSVEKTANSYRIRYTGPDGRRYREAGFKTKDLANRRLSKIYVQIGEKTWNSPDMVEITYTLTEYVDLLLARMKSMGRKERTIEEYQRYWHRHIEAVFGGMKLADITPNKVASWYARLCPDAPTERAHTYAFLRTVMRTAERDRLIDRSPCNIVGAGQAKRVSVTDLPTDMEIIMAVSFMPDRYRLMVQVGGGLGLRSGEVRGLKRGDISLKDRTIHIQRSIARYGGEEHETTTKTVSGDRTLDIPEYMIPLVETHLRLYARAEDDALLFPNVHGGLMSAQTLRNYWHKAREAAGIPTVRFHDLRHYAATMAVVRGGATTQEAIRMLGQSDSRVLSRYIDAVRGRGREIVDRMPSLVSDTDLSDRQS